MIVRQLTHLRLDRQRLAALDAAVLSKLPAVTHLFLQHNRIVDMSPLSAVPQLKFLAASHNRICRVGLHMCILGCVCACVRVPVCARACVCVTRVRARSCVRKEAGGSATA